jgi:hypothetical protein
MTDSFSALTTRHPGALESEEGRRRLVASILTLTENTRLAPDTYEQELLEQFVRGEMTIDDVLSRLDAGDGTSTR